MYPRVRGRGLDEMISLHSPPPHRVIASLLASVPLSLPRASSSAPTKHTNDCLYHGHRRRLQPHLPALRRLYHFRQNLKLTDEEARAMPARVDTPARCMRACVPHAAANALHHRLPACHRHVRMPGGDRQSDRSRSGTGRIGTVTDHSLACTHCSRGKARAAACTRYEHDLPAPRVCVCLRSCRVASSAARCVALCCCAGGRGGSTVRRATQRTVRSSQCICKVVYTYVLEVPSEHTCV